MCSIEKYSNNCEVDVNSAGRKMYDLAHGLFPICRSITGDGVRETFRILKKYIPLEITEVPSGTHVFDWIIPDEWNIKDAFIKDSKGNRIVDFKKSNLHVVGYSIPFEGRMTLEELKPHLYSLPEQPDLIPYVTSYYEKRWGFCLSHNQLKSLTDDYYEVKVNSVLKPGYLTYGELIIPGQSKEEILFSTYICHPSMANNELSGPIVTTYLANHLLKKTNLYYTYRFIFVPETIGSITYLSLHYKELIENIIAGYVVTCVGNEGDFSYLKSRNGDSLVDKITIHVLKNSDFDFKVYDFLSRGSDERQYCSPGIDLPVGSLMRSKYGEYPEYHTSGDNLDLISPRGLDESLEMYMRCIYAFENNHRYYATVLCEPQLGRRGLYPTLSKKGSSCSAKIMQDILAYCDGQNDLLSIAERIGEPIETVIASAKILVENGLIGCKNC